MDKSHSGLGITSFILSLLIWLGVVGLMIAAVVSEPSELGDDSPLAIGIGVGVVLLGLLALLGICLGIACLLQSEHKRVFGVLGILFSILAITLTIGLTMLGLSLSDETPADAPSETSGQSGS